MLLQHREHLEDAPGTRSPAALRAHPQVLLHREAREDLAALRHVAEPGAGALVRLGLA